MGMTKRMSVGLVFLRPSYVGYFVCINPRGHYWVDCNIFSQKSNLVLLGHECLLCRKKHFLMPNHTYCFRALCFGQFFIKVHNVTSPLSKVKGHHMLKNCFCYLHLATGVGVGPVLYNRPTVYCKRFKAAVAVTNFIDLTRVTVWSLNKCAKFGKNRTTLRIWKWRLFD